jgi:hypothetical protein
MRWRYPARQHCDKAPNAPPTRTTTNRPPRPGQTWPPVKGMSPRLVASWLMKTNLRERFVNDIHGTDPLVRTRREPVPLDPANRTASRKSAPATMPQQTDRAASHRYKPTRSSETTSRTRQRRCAVAQADPVAEEWMDQSSTAPLVRPYLSVSSPARPARCSGSTGPSATSSARSKTSRSSRANLEPILGLASRQRAHASSGMGRIQRTSQVPGLGRHAIFVSYRGSHKHAVERRTRERW